MAFISNTEHVTLGDGVFNNVQGNLVHNVHNHFYGMPDYAGAIEADNGPRGQVQAEGDGIELREPRMRTAVEDDDEEEEDDEIEIIRWKQIKVTQEIRGGSGYYLHAARHKGRAVVVKVFNPGPRARERLAATVALSRSLMHPNVLQIEGMSSPGSIKHFIVYEDVHWKNAENPLAMALKSDLDKSVTLALQMNFDIFLDLGDRFVVSVNPPEAKQNDNSVRHQDSEEKRAWDLFNTLCKKVLRSANGLLHTEKIDRDPAALDARRSLLLNVQPSHPSVAPATYEASPENIPSVPPRREYVWRASEHGDQSLARVASSIASDLELDLSPLNRLVWTDMQSPHRCAGYVREEITLATTKADSAVVSHDAPSPLEICPICKEVVGFNEVFECICGDHGKSWGAAYHQGWRAVAQRPTPRKQKRKDLSIDTSPPDLRPAPVPDPRRQVQSWATWGEPDAGSPPTPPSYELVPDSGSPGLFGPRSPRDLGIWDSNTPGLVGTRPPSRLSLDEESDGRGQNSSATSTPPPDPYYDWDSVWESADGPYHLEPGPDQLGPDLHPPNPGWRSYAGRPTPRKQKKKELSIDTSPRRQVPSWAHWQPDPHMPAPMPPSPETVFLVPDGGSLSPGLFGPRSPARESNYGGFKNDDNQHRTTSDFNIFPTPSSGSPTNLVPESGSPGLFGPRSPRESRHWG
ncbi:hypothetical protein C8R47DRAFT_1078103 [Mycena vitilis]|nr:hypothetical protein C8R47DRAFT_1078103 [Mycena vitilis]